ncbi:MAG: hypothetical protein KTQ49_06960 [Candidatus Omnitrophica bacterium]|nr:hypothetical protein [Candidatus Omnitrophota bacterium]
MTFAELLEALERVSAEETRKRTECFLERVISRGGLAKVFPLLEDYFGRPFKPEGQRPTAVSDRYAGPYGGIRSDQTLYFKKEERGFSIAMLWPWGNGTSITMRVIGELSEPEAPAPSRRPFWAKLFGK